MPSQRKLTVGSCFSGIGGLELGLEWTGGFETKWQIEIDPYASAVLDRHWPTVKRYTDITSVSGRQLEPVDVICGGFPCQDVSFAGKRAVLGGERTTLWWEMFRIVCEVKPQWVVAENVPGLLSSDNGRFFANILRNLADAGYDAEWGVFSSAGVGAPHLRRRVFILAHAVRGGGGPESREQQGERSEILGASRQGNVADPEISSGRISNGDSKNDVSDAQGVGRHERNPHTGRSISGERASFEWRGSPDSGWWHIEPDVGRVVDGISSFMDRIGRVPIESAPKQTKGKANAGKNHRLRGLGNAVNPYNAKQVGQMILNFHNSNLAPL